MTPPRLAAVSIVVCLRPRGGDDVAPSQAPPGFWDHWGDGSAELAGYRLTQPRYGQARRGEAVFVTVTEEFTRATRVKSDGGHGDEYPILKLNEVRDFQTGVYDYNVLTSSFLALTGAAPVVCPRRCRSRRRSGAATRTSTSSPTPDRSGGRCTRTSMGRPTR